jgi:hypothetical protein
MKEKSKKWSDFVGVCMDPQLVIVGNKGLQVLIKQSALEAMWPFCMIHCESLSTKKLCPEQRK